MIGTHLKKKKILRCLDDTHFKCIFQKQSESGSEAEIKVKVGSGSEKKNYNNNFGSKTLEKSTDSPFSYALRAFAFFSFRFFTSLRLFALQCEEARAPLSVGYLRLLRNKLLVGGKLEGINSPILLSL
jgi:hypothetical protein